MFTTTFYIVVAILSLLALIAIVLLRRRQAPVPLTPLASLAFGLILAGIVFSEERILAYSLMGTGVVIATLDAIKQAKSKKPGNISQ